MGRDATFQCGHPAVRNALRGNGRQQAGRLLINANHRLGNDCYWLTIDMLPPPLVAVITFCEDVLCGTVSVTVPPAVCAVT
jgi:hypothetical protein